MEIVNFGNTISFNEVILSYLFTPQYFPIKPCSFIKKMYFCKKLLKAVIGLDKIGLEKEKIAMALNISLERVIRVLKNHKNKD